MMKLGNIKSFIVFLQLSSFTKFTSIMKKIFVLIYITCLIKIVSAQDTESSSGSKYTLKVYNMISITHESPFFYSNDPNMLLQHRGSTTYRWFHPTFGFQVKTKKNNFHEFELTQLILDGKKTDARNMQTYEEAIIKNRYFNIRMRYEFMWGLIKPETSKINILLGMGVGPYFSSDRTQYTTISLEKSNDINMGMEIFLIPRITYKISPKLRLDINTPFSFLDLQYRLFNRKYFNMNQGFTMLRQFDIVSQASYLRIGLGLSI